MRSSWHVFWREFRRSFHTTGAVAPSSAALARALCHHLPEPPAEPAPAPSGTPRRVLEVGPGTGAVTRHILARLGPEDRLDLVEINPQFVQFLQRRFEQDTQFAPYRQQVHLHQGSVLEWNPPQRYDVVISGLPLNNFQPEQVQQFLDHFAHLAGEQGVVSFFQYVAVRRLRQHLGLSPGTRRRLRGITEVLDRCFRQYEFRRQLVLRNLPPAWVHHLRFGKPVEE